MKKFRMSPFHVSNLIVTTTCASLALVVFVLLWVQAPSFSFLCATMIFLALVPISESILQMRVKGFPWISFSSKGIYKNWKWGVDFFISWKECDDVGLFIADYGGGRYTCLRTWIYFSKIRLTNTQLNARKRPKLKQGDFIMMEYRPEVLDELLKYIDKDRIRNLHLLEK